jgi:hypothetical protein
MVRQVPEGNLGALDARLALFGAFLVQVPVNPQSQLNQRVQVIDPGRYTGSLELQDIPGGKPTP